MTKIYWGSAKDRKFGDVKGQTLVCGLKTVQVLPDRLTLILVFEHRKIELLARTSGTTFPTKKKSTGSPSFASVNPGKKYRSDRTVAKNARCGTRVANNRDFCPIVWISPL